MKILSEEFDKEVKFLKETVKHLEERLNDSDSKVKYLEDKLAKTDNHAEVLDISHDEIEM